MTSARAATRRLGRRAAAAFFCGAAVGAAVSGCADAAPAQPGWVASHPNTVLVSFQTSAPGVCAITVRYPQDAPSSIDYLGSIYVQVSREAHPTVAGGRDLRHSGDWMCDCGTVATSSW